MCHGGGVIFDSDRFWQVLELGDPRFDGWVFCGVKTTGIYCRPSCPARTPKRENVRFFASAAAAQSAGFRACKRCRPDATPGSPDWDLRADLVGRAMRLIADGVVDREGVRGLAAPSRLHRATRAAPARCGRRSGSPRSRARAASADRSTVAGDDRRVDRRRGVRRRLSERAAVQRDDPGGVRADAERPSHARAPRRPLGGQRLRVAAAAVSSAAGRGRHHLVPRAARRTGRRGGARWCLQAKLVSAARDRRCRAASRRRARARALLARGPARSRRRDAALARAARPRLRPAQRRRGARR